MPEEGGIHEFAEDGLTSVFQNALLLSEVAPIIDLPEWLDASFPYDVLDFVGRGGSGAVWKARDRKTDAWIALKVIEFTGDADLARERWLREAAVAEAVDHPNLLKILDKGLAPDKKSAWLALEWIEGQDLHKLLAESGPFSWRAVDAWLDPIFLALAELHGQGIIHRDLKPSNFLLEAETGRLVISDFGATLPIEIERFTRTTDALISFGYAAPEQLKPGLEIDARTDQFSLATSFWELLSAELPQGSFSKLHLKVASMPRWIDPALRKAMSTDPEDRFSTMAAFRQALTGKAFRRTRFLKITAILLFSTATVIGLTRFTRPTEVINVQAADKHFRSNSVRPVAEIDVYVQLDVSIQPDGVIKVIVITRSEEKWRGMKTQSAFVLFDSNEIPLTVIVCPNFGVTGEVMPGNGSSRTDYLEAEIDPALAQSVSSIKFLAHPANDQPNSPWYLDYPNTVKVDVRSLIQIIDRENEGKRKPVLEVE